MIEIRPADPAVVETGLGAAIDMPIVAMVGVDEGQFVGAAGLAWGAGRCWIWLKVLHGRSSYALPVIRYAHKLLSRAVQLGETSVFTPRDAAQPRSEKLLKALGFERHGAEMLNGAEVEIWRWDRK